MRIVSGTTGQYIYFVAVSTSDYATRVTDLTSFTVKASKDGSATASLTGTSVSAVSTTDMPGVYKLLLSDSTFCTCASGKDSEELALHITSSMAAVTRTIEIYRRSVSTGATLTVDSSGAGNADVKEFGGTTVTGRDLGASVLLSSGTGSGQIVLASGVVSASVASGGITSASFGAGAIDASAIAANAIGASELAADAANEIADAILDRDMSTGVDSGSTSHRTPRQALRFLRNKWSISGGTLTVCKEDDVTASWTGTVTASSLADPITGNDPA
jgi:hypothetical protein